MIELTYFQLWISGSCLLMLLCIIIYSISTPKYLDKTGATILLIVLICWPLTFPILLVTSPLFRKKAK